MMSVGSFVLKIRSSPVVAGGKAMGIRCTEKGVGNNNR
jgi:hypothetical protein